MGETGKLDPTKGYRAVEERLDRTKDPRRRAVLACLRDHLLAEATGNFELLLSTLAPDPHYHFWVDGSGFGEGPRGLAAVRSHYEQLFEEGRSVCEYDIDRIVVDDDVVVTEGFFDQLFPGRILRKRGAVIDDPEAVYSHRMRLLLIWPFDTNARLIGEDSYANGAMYQAENIRKLSAAEIPAVYFERLRR
ncbi:nuclear transport factor 2 family protein [Myxococcota bacterium]|nr:nuclear transport factor 2 family protein [Myxococcota bacterium]